MTRNIKIALSSLAAVVVIAGAFTAGRWLNEKTPLQKTQVQPQPAAQTAPPVQAVSAGEVRLGLNAEVEYVMYYTLCGHKVITREPAGIELIDKSREEVAKLFPDMTISSFSPDCVTVEQSVPLRCAQHFILKRNESGLSVYQTDAATLEVNEVASFPMDVENLPNDIQQMLSDGMVFETLGEIEAYLEDLDS